VPHASFEGSRDVEMSAEAGHAHDGKEAVHAPLHENALALEPEAETLRICEFISDQVLRGYRRKGVVVGLSGGVDSALVACLCARGLGRERVLGLILPEKESSPVSEPYALEQAEALGIKVERVDLTPVLSVLGVYEEKERLVRSIFPSFDPEKDRTKMSLPGGLLERGGLNVFSLTLEKPGAEVFTCRLRPEQLRGIQAAQNMKQRSRMIQLYHHAERSHYVVAGTTNRTELEQGFFVKHGDGAADFEPISHLWKTQVFQLASHVGVVEEILNRTPSPDTWSGDVGDEEFFFRLPYRTLDLLLHAWRTGIPTAAVGTALGLSPRQVGRAFRDFESKKKATQHLRTAPPSLYGRDRREDLAVAGKG
jgi:NAD+ synthase